MFIRSVSDDELYRWLVDHGRGLVCAHDRTGHLLLVNRAAAASLASQPDELVGTNLRDLLHPSVRQQFDAYLDRVWSRGSDQGLMRLIRRDGRAMVWQYDNAMYRPEGSEGLILGHARDITEEKLDEWSRRRQDERHRILIAETTQGIGRIDFERQPSVDLTTDHMLEHTRDYGYLGDCNPAFARMYGAASAQEMIGAPARHLSLFTHPANVERFRRFAEGGYRTTDVRSSEVDTRGEEREFLLNLVGVVEDRALTCIWCVQREVGDYRPEASG